MKLSEVFKPQFIITDLKAHDKKRGFRRALKGYNRARDIFRQRVPASGPIGKREVRQHWYR